MCAGIRDAANLAWKLERVMHHSAPEHLLDTYQSERSPLVREYINLTMELGQLINATAVSLTNGNPTNLNDGKQTISQLRPKLGQGLSASDSSHCGRLLPQFALSDGRLLDDVAGFRTTLLVSEEAGEKIDISVRSKFLLHGIEIVDNAGQELEAWLSERGAIAVLVSPDSYVLGTASSIKDISQLHPSMCTTA